MSAMVALPLGLAFGVASGLGAEAGVLGAVIAGFVSALTGGTPGQHSGPTGAVAVLIALSAAHFALFFPQAPEMAVAMTLTMIVLAGAMQVLFGWLGGGRLVELLPYSVVSGLLTAIGLMLILEQLPAVLGGDNWIRPMEVLLALPDMLAHPVWLDLSLGISAGLLMWLWPKWATRGNRWLPAPIFVLLLGALFAQVMASSPLIHINDEWWLGDIRVIGEMNFSLPSLHVPVLEWAQLPYLIQSAFTLAVVASLISLLGSVVTEKLTRRSHQPDRELIGQGLGNMSSGLLGGMASTGAPMRTMVAMSYGSKDAWSAALHAVLVGVLAVAVSGFFATVPLSVLAGMLIKVGLDQIDWAYLKRWQAVPKAGKTMMVAVLMTALVLDLVTAVVVGLGIASVVLLGRMTQLQLNALYVGFCAEDIPQLWLTASEKDLLAKGNGQVGLFYLDVPMSFGAARAISRKVLESPGKAFVLDFRGVPYIDFSSAMVLEDMLYRLRQQGVEVWLLLALGDAQTQLARQGVLSGLSDRVMFDREAALAQAVASVQTTEDLWKP